LEAAPPRPEADTVHRARLLSLLDLAGESRLTIVVAPPGYGKTVLLSQWVSARRLTRAHWLTVRPEHNDPARFARALSASVAPQEGSLPTTLVLDRFDCLSSRAPVIELETLLEYAPSSLRVVIATRIDPPLRLYRLRLADALVEIRESELAFTTDEAVELIRQVAGYDVSASDVDDLVDRTEGWPLALQLAAQSLRGATDISDLLAKSALDHRHVADYLTEQVLQRQPDYVRAFLLSTSVLDRMSGPLCEHVTGRRGSLAMLENLERKSLFTTRTGPDRSWFRYHHLFRAFLRHRLHTEEPACERALLHRAAAWHLERNDLEVALSYLREAGAWKEMLHLTMKHSASMFTRGEVQQVSTWIGRVPPSIRRGHRRVHLLEAAALIFGGVTDGVDDALNAVDAASTSPSDRAVAELLRSYAALMRCSSVEVIDSANGVLTGLESIDEGQLPNVLGFTGSRLDLSAAALVALGLAHMYEGRLSAARCALEGVPDEAHGVWRTVASSSLALAEAWSGNLALGEQLGRRALSSAEHLGLATALITNAQLALGLVAGARGELARAETILDDVIAHFDGVPTPAVAAWIATERAHLALAAGEPAAGLAALADHPAGEDVAIPDAVRARRHAIEALLLITMGRLDEAGTVLETAPHGNDADVIGVRVRLAVERGDVALARSLLARWPEERERRARVQRQLWRSILDHLEGDGSQPTVSIDAVVAEAESERDVGMFAAAGRHALAPVRKAYRAAPTVFLRTILDRPTIAGSAASAKELAEQLTERENVVLQFLPTRLSTTEIAERLGVSLNTVKTHLKHIYRKFGVAGRRDAVDTAERLRLL
jgi:LuxR family maltose regulon positive regulatory protein